MIALVEGDEEEIAAFLKLIKARKPEHPDVSNLVLDGHEGEIMRTGEYAQNILCFAVKQGHTGPSGDQRQHEEHP